MAQPGEKARKYLGANRARDWPKVWKKIEGAPLGTPGFLICSFPAIAWLLILWQTDYEIRPIGFGFKPDITAVTVDHIPA
jgi:hypothetical protein